MVQSQDIILHIKYIPEITVNIKIMFAEKLFYRVLLSINLDGSWIMVVG